MSEAVLSDFRSKKVFGGLDGLRFFSITAVVWHHSVHDSGWFKLGEYGFLGVDLFFVISGFLIVSLLLRECDKTGGISLKNFYIRRALRIFPVYYGFIFGLTFVYLFFDTESQFGQRFLADLPVYLLYVANFFPVGFRFVWSLASEEQFYLIWPFLEKYFAKSILWLLALFIFLNQVLNFFRVPIFEALGMPEFIDLSVMQTTFTPILLGVLLAHLLHKGIGFSFLAKFITHKFSAIGWLVALVILCLFLPEDISGLPRLVVQLMMFMLVGSVVINEQNSLSGLLTIKPLARIGAISYGIYIFHIHCIAFTERALAKGGVDNRVIVFILSFMAVIVVAEMSYRFFEKPFLKLKGRFSAVHQKHS